MNRLMDRSVGQDELDTPDRFNECIDKERIQWPKIGQDKIG
jgi:hypothetical protein